MSLKDLFRTTPASGDASADPMEDAVRSAKKSQRNNLIFFLVIIVGFFLYSMFFQKDVIIAVADDNALGVVTLESETIAFYLTDIDSAEYREGLAEFDIGSMQSGADSSSCYSGTYVNDAFGEYELHVNREVDGYLVIRHTGGVLVCNTDTAENTAALYETLRETVG